ncbi:hypothetical protein [Kitasatospora sp. HPMI-4]|uniref:hypothetical protein n=1 Tax=Kitasatospora sp. HPMI-4 TaxID=3448443 RepID=UPI003F520CED
MYADTGSPSRPTSSRPAPSPSAWPAPPPSPKQPPRDPHRPAERAELADFLCGLADFFTTASTVVDEAVNTHYGFDTVIDWIICSLEHQAGTLT